MSAVKSDLTVFGIPNCDTVRRARSWLAEHGLQATFHDFKKQGVPPDELQHWLSSVGWEALLNRKGTTWRALDEDSRNRVVDAASAALLMRAHPGLIRRPVVRWATGEISVGFDPQQWIRRL